MDDNTNNPMANAANVSQGLGEGHQSDGQHVQQGAPTTSAAGSAAVQREQAQQQQQQQQQHGAVYTVAEKRTLVRRQLMLLLHADRCRRMELAKTNGVAWKCVLPYCAKVRHLLNHLRACTAGGNCPVAHCPSSKQILDHWNSCVRTDCPLCQPLRGHFGNGRISYDLSELATNTGRGSHRRN